MTKMGPTVLLPLTDEQLALLGVALDQVQGLDAELEPIRVLMRRAAEQRTVREVVEADGQYVGASAPPPDPDGLTPRERMFRDFLRR
jgi:hypothetical protein